MALHPCHMTAHFNVSADRKWLDCLLDQRSGDFFLGIPFNILSYALLTYMIAHITGLRARKLVLVCGDSHIYNNHGEQVMKQLGRTPRPFPTLKFRDSTRLHEIDDFNFDSFIIEGYTSWQAITADMAV
jgi:thymidylate synthase